MCCVLAGNMTFRSNKRVQIKCNRYIHRILYFQQRPKKRTRKQEVKKDKDDDAHDENERAELDYRRFNV